MHDLRRCQTARLELTAIDLGDIDAVHRLTSDPRVWAHFPSGVHSNRAKTTEWLVEQAAAWERDSLGYWVASELGGGFVGVGGCSVRPGIGWNVYYRLSPRAHGHGYASELVVAARAAAAALRPDLPVYASLLEHNRASKAVAEKSGLDLVWRGTDVGNPNREAVRLIYADRDIDVGVLERLTQGVRVSRPAEA